MIAMNLPTAAVTEYSLAFTSLATVGERHFAAGPTGLYELTGARDGTARIQANIKTGRMDFADSKHKRATDAYLDGRVEGELEFHVHTDAGDDHAYPMAGEHETAPQKAHLGRGIRTRRWQFGVTNPDGEDFEITEISVLVDSASRRA